MKQHPYSLVEVYHLLRPSSVTLVSGFPAKRKNIMTLSWQFVPPINNLSYRKKTRDWRDANQKLQDKIVLRNIIFSRDCAGHGI